MLFVNRDYVVGIVFGFEINHQGRISIHAQRRCCKRCSLKTMRGVFAQHAPWGQRRIRKMIRLCVKELLNAIRVFEAAKHTQFGGSEAHV